MKETNPANVPLVGVICEFNPLHNGHAYLLEHARQLAGDKGCVICVMSGRSTQRGECAVIEPFARGRMAISGGADLVVELPFPWSSGSAEAFATAGVYILAALGVQHLIFGSECGNIKLMEQVAERMNSGDFAERYAALCRSGLGTAAAYVQAIQETSYDISKDFPASNDLLGLSYLSAIRQLGVQMAVHTVKRMGQDYRDEILTDVSFPSATALRRLMDEAACDPLCLSTMLEDTMPGDALNILLEEVAAGRAPVSTALLHPYYHTYFRLWDADHPITAELGGGLAGHLHKCALSAKTPLEFMTAIATKQYTNARLRRGMLFAVTGVTEEDIKSSPVYTQLFAANQRGRAYLSVIRKASDTIPVQVVTKPADAPDGRQKVLSKQMDALFTLCLPDPKEAGWLTKKTPNIE